MASDRLFELLAQAKAQPDRWARDLNAGTGAVKDTVGGYMEGLGIKRKMQEYPLDIAGKKAALYKNFSDLTHEVGPDQASKIMGPVFQGTGIELPPSSASGQPYTNEQLVSMPGDFPKRELEKRKVGQELESSGPEEPKSFKASVMASGQMTPEAYDAWAQANMDKSGLIPRKNADQLKANLGLKAQAARGGAMTARVGISQFNELPSKLGPSSAAGAAYQVKVAARQGKSLIAAPGSYQRIGLSQGDAARAILRNSPTDEAMRNANFSDTVINKYNAIKQKLSSDPTAVDQPEIRRELYNIFDEMDKSATPFIANHLQNMEDSQTNSAFGANWNKVKQRELGNTLSDIPFNPGTGSAGNPSVDTGVPWKMATNAAGQKIRSKDNWATFEPVQEGQ